MDAKTYADTLAAFFEGATVAPSKKDPRAYLVRVSAGGRLAVLARIESRTGAAPVASGVRPDADLGWPWCQGAAPAEFAARAIISARGREPWPLGPCIPAFASGAGAALVAEEVARLDAAASEAAAEAARMRAIDALHYPGFTSDD